MHQTLGQISELTRTTRHVQIYNRGAGQLIHRVSMPSLLWQLAHASETGSVNQERAGSGFESRPAARIETMDTLALIDREAAAQIRGLGLDDTRDTAGLLQQLGGLLPRLDAEDASEIVRLVSRWYTMARVATGWDSPHWRPRNTCPICQVQGTLRIRILEMEAVCVGCHGTWDSTEIGLLAEHMRLENDDPQCA